MTRRRKWSTALHDQALENLREAIRSTKATGRLTVRKPTKENVAKSLKAISKRSQEATKKAWVTRKLGKAEEE